MKKIILFFISIFFLSISYSAEVKEFSSNYGANMKISIQITSDLSAGHAGSNTHELTATLTDNSSARAFYALLQKGALTIKMSDYGNFEKIGALGTTLPRNDTQITTSAGDIILYQGNQITIFYGTNSWSYTRLGKIDGATQAELKKILGKGNVTAVFEILK